MAPPPISEPRFLTPDGEPAEPKEWTPLMLELPCPDEDWQRLRIWVIDREQQVVVRCLAGRVVVGCDWQEAAVGRYRVRLRYRDLQSDHTLFIPSAKLSMAAVDRLLEDLHGRLPYALAIALQRGGALAGIGLTPPEAVGIAAELDRLSRIVAGDRERPGLAVVLAAIGRDPHRALRCEEMLTHVERVRRPPVGALRRALYHQGGRLGGHLPLHLADQRVEPTIDIYENRLVRLITELVERRLHRLDAALRRDQGTSGEACQRVTGLVAQMREARRHAAFLDGVGPLEGVPDTLTMVLLRRPEYRALLAVWREMAAGHTVELDDSALEAPFENLPYLYELWGTLEIAQAVVEAGIASGLKVRQETLFRRIPGTVLIEGFRANRPMAELFDPHGGTELRIIPQRSFAGSGALRSVSFEQVPDLAVEFDRPGHETEVYLFDPKYKLRADGEQARPVKDDIDKMHAYRDAIISAKTGERVVRYAAILYPGPSCSYGDGVAALHADPEDGDAIRHLVFDAVVRGPLCRMRPERPGDQCAGQAASRC